MIINHENLPAALAEYKKWLASNGFEGKCLNAKGADLPGISLRGEDLSYADFDRANLHGADLTDAKVIEGSLDYADLTKAIVTGTNFRGSSMHGTVLLGANHEAAILEYVTG